MTLLRNQAAGTIGGANACFQLEANWTAYRAAYAEAVALLAPEASRGFDFLIYPLLFCARQAIELGLKEMIQTAEALRGKEPKFPKTHSLHKLWRKFETVMVESNARLDDATEDFARLVLEFDELDHQSDRFRYPELSDGTESHDHDELALPSIVDIPALHRTLLAMFHYIGATCDYLDDAIAQAKHAG